MRKLPEQKFFDGFFIWFDIENKKEYYSTPLYQYKTISSGNYNEGKQIIKLEKNISNCKPSKKDVALKYPAFISFPYEENIGNMLIKFLNADFSNFENAYNTFFYAYGFELLKEYVPHNELQNKYNTEVELLNILKTTFDEAIYDLKDIQYNFRKCVDYIYNLSENMTTDTYKPLSKLIASIIKRENDIYTYAKDIEIILDNFTNKYLDFENETMDSLVRKIDENNSFVKRTNTYTSPYLYSILFVILEQVASIENLPIKKCLNCKRYFIPTFSIREIYCDLENVDKSPTCREKGASATYKKNLENIPALLEYRRTYQKKIMTANRNKENKQLRKDFDKWKKQAQDKIKLFKKGEITEKELYKWMIENK